MESGSGSGSRWSLRRTQISKRWSRQEFLRYRSRQTDNRAWLRYHLLLGEVRRIEKQKNDFILLVFSPDRSEEFSFLSFFSFSSWVTFWQVNVFASPRFLLLTNPIRRCLGSFLRSKQKGRNAMWSPNTEQTTTKKTFKMCHATYLRWLMCRSKSVDGQFSHGAGFFLLIFRLHRKSSAHFYNLSKKATYLRLTWSPKTSHGSWLDSVKVSEEPEATAKWLL